MATTPDIKHRTRFIDHRIPALYAGKYTITTQQSITDLPGSSLPTRTQRFDVRGPRFAIAGTDIHACYPLPGSEGLYSQVLPHITLETPGVPWLRPLADQEPDVPWLALLVFREDELPGDPKAIGQADASTVRELLAGRLDNGEELPGRRPSINPDNLFADETELVCRSILVPKDLFTAVAPLPTEMAMLAHVREGGPPDATRGATPTPDEEELKAVVVANRFPDVAGGMHVAHLVSFDGHESILGAGASVPAEGVRLVSVWSWVFESEPDSGIGFGDLAQHIAADADPVLRLRPQKPSNPNAAQREALDRIDTGSTALPQRLPSGERTAGFYRGPLTASPARPLPDLPDDRVRLESADEALVYLETYGVYDTGYASAFTLGRALALADPEFRTHLLAWRKGARNAARRLVAHPDLAGRAVTTGTADLLTRDLARDAFDKLLTDGNGARLARALGEAGADVAAGRRHAPGARTSAPGAWTAASLHSALGRADVREVLRAATATELDPVTKWLDELVTLHRVPFEHLVPDPRMLPRESIRFFHIDPGWIQAAIDGALSIGVGHTLDFDLNLLARGVRQAPQCGVLLHSDLVEGWPETIYTALRSGAAVEPVRSAHYGTHVRMLLYPAAIDTFAMAEPPQGLHFGFGDLGTIQLREISGPNIGAPVEEGEFPEDPGDDRFGRFLRAGGYDVLNVAGQGDALLPALARAHNVSALSSAQFTLQMVKAPQLQMFVRPRP
ncbi:hypothetical protein [Streptomyces sp. CB02959]|uniref:hypothetical protein n=1 Tax=Streptomyces sp. CB02959 TaxID=2020330 RepID=UPI0015E08997|nr:hypothetical protein [Streptomyces sp. CB02959]